MGHEINVLYVHGYNGSGSGSSAMILDKLLDKNKFNLIRPDFSNRIADVDLNIKSINEIIVKHSPKIIVANSMGTFETMNAVTGPYKILINPVFDPINDLLKQDLFDESFDSARDKIIELVENLQFDNEAKKTIYGFFGDKDDRVNCQAKFKEVFGIKNMTVIENAEHRLNESEFQLVVNLINVIYDELSL